MCVGGGATSYKYSEQKQVLAAERKLEKLSQPHTSLHSTDAASLLLRVGGCFRLHIDSYTTFTTITSTRELTSRLWWAQFSSILQTKVTFKTKRQFV